LPGGDDGCLGFGLRECDGLPESPVSLVDFVEGFALVGAGLCGGSGGEPAVQGGLSDAGGEGGDFEVVALFDAFDDGVDEFVGEFPGSARSTRSAGFVGGGQGLLAVGDREVVPGEGLLGVGGSSGRSASMRRGEAALAFGSTARWVS
jgi:hypothetical protein